MDGRPFSFTEWQLLSNNGGSSPQGSRMPPRPRSSPYTNVPTPWSRGGMAAHRSPIISTWVANTTLDGPATTPLGRPRYTAIRSGRRRREMDGPRSTPMLPSRSPSVAPTVPVLQTQNNGSSPSAVQIPQLEPEIPLPWGADPWSGGEPTIPPSHFTTVTLEGQTTPTAGTSATRQENQPPVRIRRYSKTPSPPFSPGICSELCGYSPTSPSSLTGISDTSGAASDPSNTLVGSAPGSGSGHHEGRAGEEPGQGRGSLDAIAEHLGMRIVSLAEQDAAWYEAQRQEAMRGPRSHPRLTYPFPLSYEGPAPRDENEASFAEEQEEQELARERAANTPTPPQRVHPRRQRAPTPYPSSPNPPLGASPPRSDDDAVSPRPPPARRPSAHAAVAGPQQQQPALVVDGDCHLVLDPSNALFNTLFGRGAQTGTGAVPCLHVKGDLYLRATDGSRAEKRKRNESYDTDDTDDGSSACRPSKRRVYWPEMPIGRTGLEASGYVDKEHDDNDDNNDNDNDESYDELF
ncbi:hypothetical protein F4677DRAFT_444272 [Hypoxylon crocopeplum]|nr:hypothetical protein F4677DRAFT_444272 [Hypoxylon crocopeplum]